MENISSVSSADLNQQLQATSQKKKVELEQMEKTSVERESKIEQLQAHAQENKKLLEAQFSKGKVDVYA
jgi:hypothetical protein